MIFKLHYIVSQFSSIQKTISGSTLYTTCQGTFAYSDHLFVGHVLFNNSEYNNPGKHNQQNQPPSDCHYSNKHSCFRGDINGNICHSAQYSSSSRVNFYSSILPNWSENLAVLTYTRKYGRILSQVVSACVKKTYKSSSEESRSDGG